MNVITHTFVGLKCLTETKIQILCDHVDHTRFHIVEMGFQMVQLLSAHIVGPTIFRQLEPSLIITTTVFVSHCCSFFSLLSGAVSMKDMLITDDFVLIVVIQ